MLVFLSVLSFLSTLLFDLQLRRAADRFPQVLNRSGIAASPESLSCPTTAVIIPAYNEAENLEACVKSVLQSTSLPPEILQVWVVDDQSTDATGSIAQSLQGDPRLRLLTGDPRPADETWVGKNWACAQAAARVTSEYLLFIDADVRLEAGAIEAAVRQAQTDAADLLSCEPALECGCFAEWLVQPLMFSFLVIIFEFEAVNDPQSDTVFAAGPFMLFRRSAYEQIGGHRAVAHQVVDDMELARLIQQRGFKLKFMSGSDLARLRMYRSGAALWEGWTKNLYLGAQRSLNSMLRLVVTMLIVCTIPWLGLILLLIKAGFGGSTLWDGIAIALCSLTIALHYDMRRIGAAVSKLPPRYWWLTGLGGVAVAAIAIASVIKTETGWGWTWRGRSLKTH